MSVIITQTATIGPFKSIDILPDRLRCDGTDYPFSVIGDYTISADDSLAPAPPTPDLAAEISARQREVDLLAKGKRDAIVATISPAEMASWPIKRSEALMYQASSLPADAPTLGLEAEARGIPLAALVTKVLAKAQNLATLEAGISGHCGKLNDQLAACATLTEIAVINIDAGWPV